MKRLIENWRKFTEEEELEEGRLSRAIAPFVIAAASIFGGSTASAAPQEPAGAEQELSPEEQAEVKMGEKAYLFTLYNQVNSVKSPHLKKVLEDAARSGKVDTFDGLKSYIKDKLNNDDLKTLQSANEEAGKFFHTKAEARANAWDNLMQQDLQEEV